MDRNARRLSHQKGSKIVTQTNVPLSSDGDDGDQVMVGSTLYTKSQGRWMPFKSGGGNINDGWHGSQKYVKILPKDFYHDNEQYDQGGLAHYDATGTSNTPALGYTDGQTIGMFHPGANETAIGLSGTGMACSIPIPLGYWAIACKIYASHTWGPSTIPVIVASGSNEGSAITSSVAGIKVMAGSLVDGSATTLTQASYHFTNTRIVFDSAMLGQESNYLYLILNGFFAVAGGSFEGPCVYGGYIELRRVKTAGAIAEGDSETGGDSLPRSSGG